MKPTSKSNPPPRVRLVPKPPATIRVLTANTGLPPAVNAVVGMAGEWQRVGASEEEPTDE